VGTNDPCGFKMEEGTDRQRACINPTMSHHALARNYFSLSCRDARTTPDVNFPYKDPRTGQPVPQQKLFRRVESFMKARNRRLCIPRHLIVNRLMREQDARLDKEDEETIASHAVEAPRSGTTAEGGTSQAGGGGAVSSTGGRGSGSVAAAKSTKTISLKERFFSHSCSAIKVARARPGLLEALGYKKDYKLRKRGRLQAFRNPALPFVDLNYQKATSKEGENDSASSATESSESSDSEEEEDVEEETHVTNLTRLKLSLEIEDLFSQLFQLDKYNRITAEEALKHDFFRSVDRLLPRTLPRCTNPNALPGAW